MRLVYLSDPKIAQIIMGQSPPSSTYNSNGRGLPFFQGKADFGDLYPAIRIFCNEPQKIAEPGDILISVRAPVGPTNINQVKSCIGRGLAAIHSLEDIDSTYLFYFLRQYEPKLSRIGQGSTFEAVNRDDLEDILIPLPDIQEQKRIAEVLKRADRLRRLRRFANTFNNTYMEAVFFEMFGDLRFDSSQYPVYPLGKICDVRDGTHDSPDYVPEGHPLVTSKNLVNGYVDLTEVNYISEEDYTQINKRSKVDKGDILMPMIGTIGNPVLVEHDPNYAIKNVALIKFLPESPSNIYIRELLGGYYFKFIVSKSSRGGTQQFISLDDIRNFPVPLPNPDELLKFDTVVEKVERLKSLQLESERQEENLFQTLMHQVFDKDINSLV